MENQNEVPPYVLGEVPRVDAETAALIATRLRSFGSFFSRRLSYAPIAMTDADAVFEAFHDPRVSSWSYLFPQPFTRVEALKWCDRALAGQESGQFIWGALRHRETGHFIGQWDVTMVPGSGLFEVGGALGLPYWGKGFAEEAVDTVLRESFRQMPVTKAFVITGLGNRSSRRVIEAMHFRILGECGVPMPDGRLRPSLYGEMTKDECASFPPYDGERAAVSPDLPKKTGVLRF